ncbi:MAG: type II toxin-antitoxin system VapC family toxin [Prevotella sp.]|nr:type II toxin-antitoxin system VapC family toxin [Prevotella sp.]
MRYLIDTNIFVYLALDPELLSADVRTILEDPDTILNISAESIRELIVGYRNKGLCSKRWKTTEQMVAAIEDEFYIRILPLKKEHMLTYARMDINEAQGHKDPSDHVIIAHAITEHLPLISSDTRFGFYRKQGLDLVFNEKR